MMACHRESAVFTSATIAQFLQNEARRTSTRPRSRFAGLYSRLISRQLTLAWKRVTVATRRPERASKIPDGFVLVGNQWEQRQQKRRSVLFA